MSYRIRTKAASDNKHIQITPTPRNKGVEFTVKVTYYDKGIIALDDTPQNNHRDMIEGQYWVLSKITDALYWLYREHEARTHAEEGK